MTGFGKAKCDLPDKKIGIEIKTLNSKQFDMIYRLPSIFREKELEIRSFLAQKLERGKVEISLDVEDTAGIENFRINQKVAKRYFDEIKILSDELNLTTDEEILPILLKLPDVIVAETHKLQAEEWELLFASIDEAAKVCDNFRLQEGKKLDSDFRNHIFNILKLLDKIPEFEQERIEKLKIKFRKDLRDIVELHKMDENRFEQEIIYYLEKIDITEEKVRLKNHCDYFIQTLDEKFSNGKKLIFISQEIGREINTLGSKANDSNIQKFVVQMKDELEKIKEQLFNIL